MTKDIETFIRLKYKIPEDYDQLHNAFDIYPAKVLYKLAERCAINVEHVAAGYSEAENCIHISKLYKNGNATKDELEAAVSAVAKAKWSNDYKIEHPDCTESELYNANYAAFSWYNLTDRPLMVVHCAIMIDTENWGLYIKWLIEELCEWEKIMNKKIICIFHGNCAAGFSAAWIVNKALGPDVEFFPGFYQTEPPDVKDKIVYIVDFAYKRPVMEEITKNAYKVIHIDHHHTAIRDMAGFSANNFESLYSPHNTESGAMLTWRYFYPTVEVPRFIKYIDDRDRWQFKLPGSKEVQSNVFSYEYTFENWDMLMEQDLEKQIQDGTAIERRLAKEVKELMGVIVRRMNIGGYNVPVANVPYQLGSDICHALAKNEPFSAYYYDKPCGREFGLRSGSGGLHVGEIAKLFGGGGHEHASGFRVTYEEAKKFEV